MLTKKFISLIEESEEGILDLNKAADTLKVCVWGVGAAVTDLIRCARSAQGDSPPSSLHG